MLTGDRVFYGLEAAAEKDGMGCAFDSSEPVMVVVALAAPAHGSGPIQAYILLPWCRT